MKEPDKIYLEKERETNKISHLWGVSPVLHSGYEHIEYIRKDALVEWLNRYVNMTKNADPNIPATFKVVLDKINSL